MGNEININDKKAIKASLCTTGFEEQQNFRTGIPTCSKEAFCFTCCFVSSNQSTLCHFDSLDIKTVKTLNK